MMTKSFLYGFRMFFQRMERQGKLSKNTIEQHKKWKEKVWKIGAYDK